jgi:hypothetical protein
MVQAGNSKPSQNRDHSMFLPESVLLATLCGFTTICGPSDVRADPESSASYKQPAGTFSALVGSENVYSILSGSTRTS